MTPKNAVLLLVQHFPSLKQSIDEDDLLTRPHIACSLLAAEVLENNTDEVLLTATARFVDDLANSHDSLLEELLVIDILEGVAQNADVSRRLQTQLSIKPAALLMKVEREYFRRSV